HYRGLPDEVPPAAGQQYQRRVKTAKNAAKAAQKRRLMAPFLMTKRLIMQLLNGFSFNTANSFKIPGELTINV
ncbi:hypothetical protein, partial [Aeromonas sp. R3-1]|uniref:hypothetical protein n=1 Tax=Aeromonas sp. R3-1 TaxID=3138463 RepID=UPI0034A1F1A7